MRASSRLVVASCLTAVFLTRPLAAEIPFEASRSGTVQLIHDFWSLVTDVSTRVGLQDRTAPARPRPQAIPRGGPSVDLSDLSQPTILEEQLRSALDTRGELRLSIPDGMARRGDYSIGSEERSEGHLLVIDGDADVHGTHRGNLVTVRGNVTVHPGSVVSGDILTLGGEVRDRGGEIGGEVRTLRSAALMPQTGAAEAGTLSPVESTFRRVAGVLGVFLTLSVLGFGLVLFGHQNLEIVSDTVSHSFGRALVTGLLGQILLLPTFGMLVVGLILSVAGILLLPFAVAVFAMLVVVGVVGGCLAVAHALGETYTRRRMAQGVIISSPNSYRYLLLGLLALGSLWAAWALFGWVPVAGSIMWGAAFFFSWLLGTAGFGATLLSRAGIKENFSGRLFPPEAMTDEYLWATPQFGVPAGKRPGTRTPSRGL
ncbi:MAG TPA: polymer-forming cytoskeletal protein [Gemmatimonadales bacterium]|nr:polymer-forming cytoskeletal protein [Gemmatimonadales bacterium]